MTLMFFCGTLCQDQERITAQCGDNVSLKCSASDNNPVTVVRLSRPDLSPEYALFYRNDKMDEQNQNPRFKGRTNLQSTNIADGKVSLTLDNVTNEDSGTYVCRVKTETNGVNKRRKRAITETVIQLNVAPATGDKDGNKAGGVNERGHIGLVVGMMFSALTLTAAAAFVWKRKMNSSPPHPPHNEAEQPLQLQ
ncbi:hypothetical protein CHARACLAT_030081 [Characodon lateralis]|uniref:Ig-like domain-containing protein n=1 Tax=Characodon lateralis TaxID=208331 RepID=A0ABU7DFE8_9TELE|nr:hypothetical protein [Characodon lateralis]